jgi:hypothetical protein
MSKVISAQEVDDTDVIQHVPLKVLAGFAKATQFEDAVRHRQNNRGQGMVQVV